MARTCSCSMHLLLYTFCADRYYTVTFFDTVLPPAAMVLDAFLVPLLLVVVMMAVVVVVVFVSAVVA